VPNIVLLAAVAQNGVIGRDNTLPWRLKSDMAHFRAVTMGKPVMMGRKTFLSIGKPLNGRTTIVVSRDPSFAAPGIVVAASLRAAIETAGGDALRRGSDAIIVAGGADIYVQALPLATRLDITEVGKPVEGDTYFPTIDRQIWRETGRSDHQPAAGDEVPYAFVTYERIIAAGKSPPSVA
jgi:dihydrofolate reductase